MRERTYQRCTKCVMDTTDSKITFDDNGVCDHCRNFEKISRRIGNLRKINLMNYVNLLNKSA